MKFKDFDHIDRDVDTWSDKSLDYPSSSRVPASTFQLSTIARKIQFNQFKSVREQTALIQIVTVKQIKSGPKKLR